MMLVFEQNYDNYIYDNQPNIESIHNYIASYMIDNGIDTHSLTKNETFKNKMMSIYDDIAEIALANCSSFEEYIDMQCLYMENIGISDEDILIYRNFDVEIANMCMELTNNQIHNYSDELNELILNSEVSLSQKVDLAIGAQAAINSVLFWNQYRRE